MIVLIECTNRRGVGDPIAAVATTHAALEDARHTATLLSRHLRDAHCAVAAVVLHHREQDPGT